MYAVIGNPIEHSVSPYLHQLFAKSMGHALVYRKILGEHQHVEAQIRSFFAAGGQGLNVTQPFKQHAYAMADHVADAAAEAEAANTLWQDEQGRLCCDNTDGEGLLYALTYYLSSLKSQRILLVGAGGAARAVLGSLLTQQLALLTVSNRTLANALSLCALFPQIEVQPLELLTERYDVIINATSASLFEQLPAIPVPVVKDAFCMDMVYGKQPTLFMRWALAHGATQVADGLMMLVAQAAASFKRWHKAQPDVNALMPIIQKAFKSH